jgi:hypothetical protein
MIFFWPPRLRGAALFGKQLVLEEKSWKLLAEKLGEIVEILLDILVGSWYS